MKAWYSHKHQLSRELKTDFQALWYVKVQLTKFYKKLTWYHLVLAVLELIRNQGEKKKLDESKSFLTRTGNGSRLPGASRKTTNSVRAGSRREKYDNECDQSAQRRSRGDILAKRRRRKERERVIITWVEERLLVALSLALAFPFISDRSARGENYGTRGEGEEGKKVKETVNYLGLSNKPWS